MTLFRKLAAKFLIKTCNEVLIEKKCSKIRSLVERMNVCEYYPAAEGHGKRTNERSERVINQT